MIGRCSVSFVDEAEYWVGSGIAGRVLHITPRYARRLALQGRLPHRRTLGGQVLFSVSVLRELHAGLVGAFAESFEEAVGGDPTALGNGRPRRARPRPTPAEGLPVVPRRLSWYHDATTGCFSASGPGWQANIEVADGRYQASVLFDDGRVRSWSGGRTGEAPTLVACQRWVRRAVERAHTHPSRPGA